MVLGNPSIVVQNMFGITPEPLDAIDVILAPMGKGFAVVQAVVFAPALQGIVAPERVGVVDGSLAGMRTNVAS